MPLRTVGAITLVVEDLTAAKTFYAAVFAAPLVHEDDSSAVFDFGNTLVNLLDATAAPELVAPAAVGRPGDGSRVQFTIWVDDVHSSLAELRERGVNVLNGPIDRPWGLRTASFTDPAGHIWELAQPLAN